MSQDISDSSLQTVSQNLNTTNASFDHNFKENTNTQCSICLQNITNLCYLVSCYHSFCLGCIVGWINSVMINSNYKGSSEFVKCPLCNLRFTKLLYNVTNYNDDKFRFSIFDLVESHNKNSFKSKHSISQIVKIMDNKQGCNYYNVLTTKQTKDRELVYRFNLQPLLSTNLSKKVNLIFDLFKSNSSDKLFNLNSTLVQEFFMRDCRALFIVDVDIAVEQALIDLVDKTDYKEFVEFISLFVDFEAFKLELVTDKLLKECIGFSLLNMDIKVYDKWIKYTLL